VSTRVSRRQPRYNQRPIWELEPCELKNVQSNLSNEASADRVSNNTDDGSQHTLKRALGPGAAIAMVVGSVIGAGIFFKPGRIAAEAGRFDLIIGVWVLGGVLCILGAICFAELATMFPQAGGLYVYLREAYGRMVAFLFGWIEFLFAKPAAIGALSVAFVGKLGVLVNRQLSPTEEVVISSVLIAVLTVINVFGVKWGGRVQTLMTVIKGGLVAGIALLPFVLMPFLDSTISLSNFTSTAPPRQSSLAVQISVVLLAVMWAYHGWHGLTPLAEEVRDPQRNLPLALIGGLGIVMLLYVSANVAYHGVLSMAELRTAGTNGAEMMLNKLMGSIGASAIAAIIMCSTSGAINSNILEAPRVAFAMGRDGVFFRVLGLVHQIYRTPVAAILVTALMSIGWLVTAAVAKLFVADSDPSEIQWMFRRQFVMGLRDNSIFELLTNLVVFASAIFHSLTVLAVFVLRWQRPDAPRPFRTWGYPVVPAAFLVINIWFMYQIFQSNKTESLVGLGLIALGIPVYWIYRQLSRSAA
jgi:APA family basic amino acid/polyamine antiporter